MSMIKSLHQLGWFSRARFGREAPVPLTTHNGVHDKRLASDYCVYQIRGYVL